MLKRLLYNKWYIVVILALMTASPSLSSWLYLWLQKMYNSVTIGTSHNEILRLILIGVLVWMVNRLVTFSISVVKSRFICNIKQDLKHDLFVNVFGLKTASISRIAASGEYISIFINDIVIIEQRYFSNIINLISQIISIVILGSTFFSMNKKLAFWVCLFSLFVMFVPAIFSKKLNAVNLLYSNSLSKFTQKLKEYLTAYSTIKNYSVERMIINKFKKINDTVEDAKFKYDCSLSLANSIGSLLTWFTRIIVIGAGLIMVSNGEILLGTVVAAEAFTEELAYAMQEIVENVNSIKSVKSITRKIESLTNDSDNSVATINDLETTFQEDLNIKFSHLTIPVKEKNIISDFSFEFRQGKKYLIVGKNGSGKSSIFKALKKNLGKYQGDILINGIELRNVSNEELSRLVSYLNESVAIFSGSVEENIILWREVSQASYEEAVKKAHIELDLSRSVGADGFDISSGEQRKIEIARSLISPVKLMIFDEVVSTLDIETAYDIEKAALGYDDKTVIFISHNFSGKLIREYDEILVMKDGSLVAHGNYDALVRENDYFRHICEIKFG